MNYKIRTYSDNGTFKYENDIATFICEKDDDNAFFSMTVDVPFWDNDSYLFMPACVYDGNRFKKSYVSYPPMYKACELGTNPEPVISDVPSLNPNGSGTVEVTSADMSLPCVGVFSKKAKCAVFVFTEQQCCGKNIGFHVETGKITVQFPAKREAMYVMCNTKYPSSDRGICVRKGEKVLSCLKIRTFDCENILQFYEIFFDNRHKLLFDKRAKCEYTRELWNICEEHMNEDNFSGEYYAETSKKWQAGWVGGGMSSLPLLQFGNEKSKERAIQTIDFLTSHISDMGFFYGVVADGKICDDGFGNEHMKNCVLTRKIGDVLYFLFKHFDIVKPKKEWVDASKLCADAMVSLYEKYSSFGQFINVENGEMMFGGTASGASVIGALVKAWKFFDDEKYLNVAKSSGEKYYTDFVARGISYGGPGEALCAPDSESAYALTESMTLLYEATGENRWLDYAQDSLRLFSSWVMPYSFKFPDECEFARLKINTVGSVFANVQNKHSAPGICTSSGEAIYKIYKYTKKQEYLELLRDIVSFIPQCVSTQDRPIYSWDNPSQKLKSGYICERVNTSDWELEKSVGGVFNGSCWPETSLLLTFSELIWNAEICKELFGDLT